MYFLLLLLDSITPALISQVVHSYFSKSFSTISNHLFWAILKISSSWLTAHTTLLVLSSLLYIICPSHLMIFYKDSANLISSWSSLLNFLLQIPVLLSNFGPHITRHTLFSKVLSLLSVVLVVFYTSHTVYVGYRIL